MSTIKNKDNKNKTNIENTEQKYFQRKARSTKTLGTVPVLGAMAYGVYKKTKNECNRLAADMFHFQRCLLRFSYRRRLFELG